MRESGHGDADEHRSGETTERPLLSTAREAVEVGNADSVGAQAAANLFEVCDQRAQLGVVIAGVQGVDKAVANVE